MTPERYASFISKVLFVWFDGLSWKGWRKLLTENDMWTLMKENRGQSIVPVWDRYWNKQKEDLKKSPAKVSFYNQKTIKSLIQGDSNQTV